MTENQWPQDGSYASSPTTRQAPRAPGRAPEADTHPSTLDTIKDEAGHATGQAKESATNVLDTAKTEAANVAVELKTNAMDLLDQAKVDLTDQAAMQQQKVSSGLRSISAELHSMANSSNDPGVATDLVRQAAVRSSSVATWLDNREPGAILEEVKTFARQRPGAFLLLAAGAGVLAGRLGRSLSGQANGPARRTATEGTARESDDALQSGMDPSERFAPATGMTVPPSPVQLPGPDITTAGQTPSGNEPLNEGPTTPEAYPPDLVYGAPEWEPREVEPRSGTGPESGGPR
jgi:hypothetical protein